MYLPYTAIQKMLAHAGFNKTIHLYVNPGGKHYGWLWQRLTKVYDIRLHVGDNYWSDVVKAYEHGIRPEWVTIHAFTPLETALKELGLRALALVLRQFRLDNPYTPDSTSYLLYDDQAQYNLSVLLLLLVQLKTIMEREQLTRLLLTTRDGCLLEKLFDYLIPDYVNNVTVIKFHSSRLAYQRQQPEYERYVKEVYVPKESIIFDLHGYFISGRPLFKHLFNNTLPRVHLLSANAYYMNNDTYDYPQLTYSTINHLEFEFMNVDVVGQLLSVFLDENTGTRRFHRAPVHGYPIEFAWVIHQTIDAFCSLERRSEVIHALQQVEHVLKQPNKDVDGGGKDNVRVNVDVVGGIHEDINVVDTPRSLGIMDVIEEIHLHFPYIQRKLLQDSIDIYELNTFRLMIESSDWGFIQGFSSNVLTNTHDWQFLSTNNSGELLGLEMEHLYGDRYQWSFLYVDADDGLNQSLEHTDEGMRKNATVEQKLHNNTAVIDNTAAMVGNYTHQTATTIDKDTVAQSTADQSKAKVGSSQVARCLSTLQIFFASIKNVHVTRCKTFSHITNTMTTSNTTDPAISPSESKENNASNTNPYSHHDPTLVDNTTHYMHDVVFHRLTCSDIQELNTLLPRLWALMKPKNSLYVMVLSQGVHHSADDHKEINYQSSSDTISTTSVSSTCFDAVFTSIISTNSTNNSTSTIATEIIPLPSHSTLKCCPLLDSVIGTKCVHFSEISPHILLMTLNTSMCFLWKQQSSQCDPTTNNQCLSLPLLTTYNSNNQEYNGYLVEMVGVTHYRPVSEIVMHLLLISINEPKELVHVRLRKDPCRNRLIVDYLCGSYDLLQGDCRTLGDYAVQLTYKILLPNEKTVHLQDDISCKDLDIYIVRDVRSNGEIWFDSIDMMVYSNAVKDIHDVPLTTMNPIEKIDTLHPTIWMMWWQGWQFSPRIAQKCVESWRKHHPDWPFILLDKNNIDNYFSIHKFLPHLNLTHTNGVPVVHYSGIIRFGLLYHYGGIWADATIFCHKPPEPFIYNPVTGFFTFDNTMGQYHDCLWLLGSISNSYISQRMFEETIKYWKNRDETDEYFWASNLFLSLYQTDDEFHRIWDMRPHLPYETVRLAHLMQHVMFDDPLGMLLPIQRFVYHPELYISVSKLTYKYDINNTHDNSVLTLLLTDQFIE